MPVFLALAACFVIGRAGRAAAGEELTLAEADRRLAVAGRMLEGGIYDRARELAGSILDDPAARGVSGTPEEIHAWLSRRETARFSYERARFGLATTREEYLDVAGELAQLVNNRYRLPDPAYPLQAAYWAGRAYAEAGEYRKAVEYYSRVGGAGLPEGMEGDAARRMSYSLRMEAEEIPFPGGLQDRQRRAALLNQAINELDRAHTAFPIGERRKEVELELIALRLARREEQYAREAAAEAAAFIEREPAKDALRARAALYRARAASLLGDESAAAWFRRVLDDEAPDPDDRREAELGLGLTLIEEAASRETDARRDRLESAAESLGSALDGARGGKWDGARVILAETLLDLDRPAAALDALAPILSGARVNPRAWLAAGTAESRRGRLAAALDFLYPVTRPSVADLSLRYNACRAAAAAASGRRDFGLSLAMGRQASRLLRQNRLFGTLLTAEYDTMESLLRLGRLDGPVSLSGDVDLLRDDSDARRLDAGEGRREADGRLARSLGAFLAGGGTDAAHDLAVSAEAAGEVNGDALGKLELSIAMIQHLRVRQPRGVGDGALSSRMGEARHALALVRVDRILAGDEPDMAEVDRALADFAAASQSFQAASAGGLSNRDSLDQGVVNMESGGFLSRLAERWNQGRWSGQAGLWRDEARQRIEASLKPFNQAIAATGAAGLAGRRARWSRGRALELLGEWRGAAQDYLSLMNNSELPRLLRVNAARHWAICTDALGETRQAMARLAVFADSDAESALLYGRLAEAAGALPDAYGQYLAASDPAAPAMPPATRWRSQEAAYRAAGLALANPSGVRPADDPAATVAAARRRLEEGAMADIDGDWAIPMLDLLGDSLMREAPENWRRVYVMAMNALEKGHSNPELERAMRILAARAMSGGGNQEEALNQLDRARGVMDESAASRRDGARITLETARIYRKQGRSVDAVRAYADVFAVYPDAVESAEAARIEAATLLLDQPDGGDRAREQARNILSGVRDQVAADALLRRHGMR